MKEWFGELDQNKDGFIDRCEDATFLRGVGNTIEYSLNYAGEASLADVQGVCKMYVLTAFDDIAEMDKDKHWYNELGLEKIPILNLFIEGMDHDEDADDDSTD